MRANPTRRPPAGDVVHIEHGWRCRHAIVADHPRRGLSVMVGAPVPSGWLVLEGLRRDLGRRPGTWHPYHPYGAPPRARRRAIAR